jgi:DNA-binding transcriptional MerR regulator
MEEPLFKIGELAAFFNVSSKAVRIYEEKGIIKPAKVDPDTGYRYYTIDQVKQVNTLLELKALGFSLKEIKNILSGKMSSSKLVEELEHKKMTWLDMIAVAENKTESIESIIQRINQSNTAKKLQEMTDEERAWLLVKMVCVEDLRGQSVLSEALWL